MRSLAWGMAVLVAVIVAGCGKSAVSLQTRPHDSSAARLLAQTVADQAECPYLEDFDLKAKDHWEFTCETSHHFFHIVTYGNPSVKEVQAGVLNASNEPYKLGRYFLIYQGRRGNRVNAPGELGGFPGDLVNPRH